MYAIIYHITVYIRISSTYLYIMVILLEAQWHLKIVNIKRV